MTEFSRGEHDSFLDIAVDELKKQLAEAFNPQYFIDDAIRELAQRHPEAYETSREISMVIEPIDSNGAFDENCGAAQAFFMGMILGTKAAGLLSTEAVHDMRLASLPKATISDDSDAFNYIHAQGQLFMEKGIRAYAEAHHYHWIFDQYEDQLVPDVTKQHFLKSGFGMAMDMTNEVSLTSDIRKELSSELQSMDSLDWDSWEEIFKN